VPNPVLGNENVNGELPVLSLAGDVVVGILNVKEFDDSVSTVVTVGFNGKDTSLDIDTDERN
jgi:hypothetical protein